VYLSFLSAPSFVLSYDEPYMEFDPLGVAVSSYGDQSVMGQNVCYDIPPSGLNGYMTRWWTDDTAIATATMNKINGIATGSTNHHASGDYLSGDPHAVDNTCPQSVAAPQAPTNVKPAITSITPPRGLIGNSLSVTIVGTGFGASGLSVSGGSGISVSIDSFTSTQIQATFRGCFKRQRRE
jgi:hypothetical protein